MAKIMNTLKSNKKSNVGLNIRSMIKTIIKEELSRVRKSNVGSKVQLINKMIKEEIRRIREEEYDHDFDFESAYNDAPPEVQELLDDVGDEQDYRVHDKLKKQLEQLGYDYDYDLSGTATYLAPKSTNESKKLSEAQVKNINLEQPISNLYIKGWGLDPNGNWRIIVGFPNDRGWKIQTNGKLPETNEITRHAGKNLTPEQLTVIGKEITDYVQKYGSKDQKSRLKIYNR